MFDSNRSEIAECERLSGRFACLRDNRPYANKVASLLWRLRA
jgi:hypothetical protein